MSIRFGVFERFRFPTHLPSRISVTGWKDSTLEAWGCEPVVHFARTWVEIRERSGNLRKGVWGRVDEAKAIV